MTAEERLKVTIGELMFTKAVLETALEAANKKIAELSQPANDPVDTKNG